MTDSGARILVLDDEADGRRSNQKIIQKVGYIVDTAASAAEAIEKVRRTAYRLAGLDINPPDKNGNERVENAKAIRLEMPVTLLTGYATPDHAGPVLAHGSADVLEKIAGDTADKALAADRVARVSELSPASA